MNELIYKWKTRYDESNQTVMYIFSDRVHVCFVPKFGIVGTFCDFKQTDHFSFEERPMTAIQFNEFLLKIAKSAEILK